MKFVVRNASCLYLIDWGEPAVCSEFGQILKMLRSYVSPEVLIGFATNGLIAHGNMLEILFDGHPRYVIVSVNASNPKDYRRVTGIDGWSRVLSYIDRLVVRRQEMVDPDRLEIHMSFVVTAANYYELFDFFRLAVSSKVQGVVINEFIEYESQRSRLRIDGDVRDLRALFLKSLALAGSRSLDVVSTSKSWYLNPPRPPEHPVWCEEPWKCFRVQANGDVTPCCFYKGSCGNVLREEPEDIWWSQAYQQLRQCWIEDNPPNTCLKCLEKWRSPSYDMMELTKWRRYFSSMHPIQ